MYIHSNVKEKLRGKGYRRCKYVTHFCFKQMYCKIRSYSVNENEATRVRRPT